MMRHRSVYWILSIAGFGAGFLPLTPAYSQPLANPSPQSPAASRPSSGYSLSTPEINLLRSLQANPVTAPYAFATQRRGTKVALRARVGTKVIHDTAIQTAIALGVPVIDDIVIDTLAAHQAAAPPGAIGGSPYGSAYNAAYGSAGPSSGLGGFPGAGGVGPVPYTYPPPLFGRLDDPFFGFEPPAISYPSYWGALSENRVGPPAANQNMNPQPQFVGYSNSAASPANGANLPAAANQPINPDDAQAANLPYGTIDMAIDPRGVATLRGTVPTLAERITLGQKIAQTPGVTQVVNLLNVKAAPPTLDDKPPPPPVPAEVVPVANPPVANPAAPEVKPIVSETDNVGQRASKAIAARPGIGNSSVKVKVRDGIALLSGKVPTVYEAMIAFRAVQKTPGVREVEDKLEFLVPDGTTPNPLADKGLTEDVEPYLEAQLRRQLGDLAHIDRVRIQGDSLELKGTLGREEDRPRFDAIIRSMAILRGFRITAQVPAEAP